MLDHSAPHTLPGSSLCTTETFRTPPSCLRSSCSSSNPHLEWDVFSPPAHPDHPPRVIELSALWAGFPWSTSPLNCHSCWPLCVPPGLRAHWWPGLALKEDSRNICWAEKNLVLPSALRHPHGWGSGLLVRPPKKVTSPMFSETSPNTQWPCHLTIFTFQLSTKHVLPCPTSVPWDLSWNPSYTSASITSFVP